MPPTLRRGPSTGSVPCSGRTVLSLLLAFNSEPVRPEVSKDRPRRKSPVRAELVEALYRLVRPFDTSGRTVLSLLLAFNPKPVRPEVSKDRPRKNPFGLSLSKPCANAANPSTRAFDK